MKYKLSELVECFSVPAFVFETENNTIVNSNALLLRNYGMGFIKNHPVKITIPEEVHDNPVFFLRLTDKHPIPVLEQSSYSVADFQTVMFSRQHGIVFELIKENESEINGCAMSSFSDKKNTEGSFNLNYIYNIASGKRNFAAPKILAELNFIPALDSNLDWRSLIVEDDLSLYDNAFLNAVKNGGNNELNYHIRSLDGRIYHICDYCGVVAPDNQWPIMVGSVVCRQKHDDVMVQAEKQVLTCRMMGGMIHDFKNLLGGIRNIIEWAVSISDDPRVCDALKKTLTYTDHATELIVGTLQLNQGGRDSQEEIIDVGKVICELENLIAKIIPASTAMKVSIEENIPMIFGPKSLLKDMLLNLCVNARDAMKNKGSVLAIDVRTIAVTDDNGDSQSCISLSVSDDGCGISKAEVSRVFDAFYSTKPQGAGLGMWMVRNAVNAFRGRIEVESEVGIGTTIRVIIPVFALQDQSGNVFVEGPDIPEIHENTEKYANLQANGKNKTLLYIEDNLLIGSGVCTWLESFGFTVLFADNGLSGKAMFEENHKIIDAIIQDYVLPGIKGDELLRFFTHTRPDIPVIVVSAENDVNCINQLLELGARDLIRKPFKMDDLFAGLAKILK